MLASFATLALLLTTPEPAAVPPPPAADLPKLPFDKYVLPNGLEVILH
jgi:hypothetical protein